MAERSGLFSLVHEDGALELKIKVQRGREREGVHAGAEGEGGERGRGGEKRGKEEKREERTGRGI